MTEYAYNGVLQVAPLRGAEQRYYASSYGSFNTADPKAASAVPNNPRSWNRYAYVGGDPANHNDRSGMDDQYCGPDEVWDGEGCTDGAGGSPPVLDPCTQIYDAVTGSVNCGSPVAPPPQPAQPAAPPPPTCSIDLLTRGVPFPGSPANHTYIEVFDSAGQGVGPSGTILEGGPSNHPRKPWSKAWGSLVALQENVPAAGQPIPKGTFLGGTNPYTNTELGSETGDGTCADVMALLNAIGNYDSGSGVAYAPLPNGTSTFNSNSFTYTLLNDIGLAGVFQSSIGWSPGWGQTVPGLQP